MNKYFVPTDFMLTFHYVISLCHELIQNLKLFLAHAYLYLILQVVWFVKLLFCFLQICPDESSNSLIVYALSYFKISQAYNLTHVLGII